MKYSLYIGRFQPFHDGHRAIVNSLLNDGKNVLIAIRDTEIDENNPYSTAERSMFIAKIYSNEPRVRIITLPDITEVCYGRGVGYGVREVRIDAKIEAISATEIRKRHRKLV